METKRCCGTCKWRKHHPIGNGWLCANDSSKYYKEFAPYHDTCEKWEGLTG